MDPKVAYFSMEIALESHIPTYSGGLGVLAGDLLRSAADLGFPMVGVSLLHRKGYFHQQIDSSGFQTERPVAWRPEDWLKRLDVKSHVTIEGRRVRVGAWEYVVRGQLGRVPVVLLDTDLPENSESDRHLTDTLYGGDQDYRFCQEIVLGLGGARLLRHLGHQRISSFHMNEGHAALLALALLEADLGESDLSDATEEDMERVRSRCIFTTHTPVAAGHDRFSRATMERFLGKERSSVLDVTHCCPDGTLNMSYLALRFSRYVNGVAMRHGEVAQEMFPQHAIRAITNGVHAGTWTCPAFQRLFDENIPAWRAEPQRLRYAAKLSPEQILEAHAKAKGALLTAVNPRLRAPLSADAFTIGFARRFTGYKRPTLILSDTAKLVEMAKKGPIQIIYSGKAHPRDESGRRMVQQVQQFASSLPAGSGVRIEFLEEYDLELARKLVAGVDLWLNTPQPPLEASGTSGMKAALNGVPSLSTRDGWWLEGHFQGVTGWAIDGDEDQAAATSLYSTLANEILPLFYHSPLGYAQVMRSAIAINGSFFNTHRMLEQYIREAYQGHEVIQKLVSAL